MADERALVAIFCDDIRQEVGNKLSFMGCYADDLVLENLPATLPKLCVYVTAHTPFDDPFELFVVRATLNGEVLAAAEFPTDELRKGLEELRRSQPVFSAVTDERQYIRIATAFAFQPLVITTLGRIRIQAETERGALKASSLEIRTTPSRIIAAAQN